MSEEASHPPEPKPNEFSERQAAKERRAFKRHIVNALNAEARRLQKLFFWCQTNTRVVSRGLAPYDEMTSIFCTLKEVIKRLESEKEK